MKKLTLKLNIQKTKIMSSGRTAAAAAANSLQLCPTLCNPIPGILQARTLECIAISFPNA